MDRGTLEAYDRDAAAYAEDWETQPAAADMHALILRYFKPGPTADVGCGSGRDAAWLTDHGFPATGYVAPHSFDNVLCETVIMHLPAEDIAPSVQRLIEILKPGGTLYLSWRVTEDADRRDEAGRLYGAFDPGLVLDALTGADILLDEQSVSASSAKVVRRLVARRR